MIRTPLRPLARILQARQRGENPDHIERENLRLRIEAMRDTARARAESRLLVMAGVFLAGFVLIGAQMALLAATEPMAPTPGRTEAISSERADILDRNGRVLATNLTTHALYAETRHMVDPVRAARELGAIFPDIDAARLERQFTDPNRRFVWVRARLSPEQRQAVHDIGEPGLMFGQRKMRIYPNGTLAAHVLGGASFGEQGVRAAEVIGVAGVEHHFDERLRDPALLDRPLQLSLDMTIQAVVTEVLSSGMRMLGARGASAVIMDPHSGEVIALVSLPDFDPNNRPPPPTEGEPADSVLFNRAVQGYYELGSVMKSFTVAQALDDGMLTPDTMVDTRSPMQVGRFRISDFRNYGPQLSATDVIVRSSNVGTARLAQQIGPQSQRDFLDKLGFLSGVPVELAETLRARPLLPGNWSELSAMTISYGHGLTTSPLQLAAGYSTLVNGGYLVTPTLERQPGRGVGEQVISERTSAQMRYMLHQVVERGTASFARIPGYAVGGKTGSADKPKASGGGYYEGKVLATFVGAFPMDNPRYVIAVTLDEPEDTTGSEPRRTAGWTAVPVTGEIVRRIAPLLDLRPRPASEIEQAMQNALAAAR
ncbi:penicillin-binding protein 2 [Rhodobacteraceae bacterium 2376]|uniref:Penicillin-binding protein 2 n=1 Tax=Rhabdonatronobacter sediminivivens TaxID=2743469 RepID=A0A7Z0HXQ7_9RHOB|nr:penicillin-binding protein 2 [Rhabdonatronobacter sediminivivens]NYS24238.1 penicillin-binding protein 2 [Rhabdonatronobacter sediminivivens]